jgi:hypothetical protein
MSERLQTQLLSLLTVPFLSLLFINHDRYENTRSYSKHAKRNEDLTLSTLGLKG